jgi:hypothetical protein
MDYIEFKLWKAGLFVLAAFIWGIWCGITGRSLDPQEWGPSDNPTGAKPGRSEGP